MTGGRARDAEEGSEEPRIDQLRLEEKVALVTGRDFWHTGSVERLSIEPLTMSDGPVGVRTGGPALCLPCGASMAATWDPPLVESLAAAVAAEALERGVDLLLAPTVNICRYALAGRNFECFGEDPNLAARLAAAYVRGVQSRGVAAVVKHFVCNDAEHRRHTVDCEVPERALREIYLVPFHAAVVEAGALGVMAAYNRVNGTYACEHRGLLHDVLKEEWGFEGVVVSDWWATASTVPAALAGLDLEMPGPPVHWGARLEQAVRERRLDTEVLDDKVRRLLRLRRNLRAWRVAGSADPACPPPAVGSPSLPAPAAEDASALARRAAAAGTVLLSNPREVLPLDASDLRSVAVLGPNAARFAIQGGGSAGVVARSSSSLAEAVRRRLRSDATVAEGPGCLAHRFLPVLDSPDLVPWSDGADDVVVVEHFDNPDCAGEPVRRVLGDRLHVRWFGSPVPGARPEDCSVRVRSRLRCPEPVIVTLGLASVGRSRLAVDGRSVVDNWSDYRRGDSFYGFGSSEARADVPLLAGEHLVEVRLAPDPAVLPGGVRVGALVPAAPSAETLLGEAERLAAAADRVVVVVGTDGEWETEGLDRTSLRLPGLQDELVRRVARGRDDVVVVVNAGAPVAMPWADEVGAVLLAWFPGEQAGPAVADVLFGDADPGGRLPVTFPLSDREVPVGPADVAGDTIAYHEGSLVGYRGYDAMGLDVRYCFGHGLSYATFDYGPLSASLHPSGEHLVAAVTVANIGDRPGWEVVQLYGGTVAPQDDGLGRVLLGFAKCWVPARSAVPVVIEVPRRAFSRWDPGRGRWRPVTGAVELAAGRSSRDLRCRATVVLQGLDGEPT